MFPSYVRLASLVVACQEAVKGSNCYSWKPMQIVME